MVNLLRRTDFHKYARYFSTSKLGVWGDPQNTTFVHPQKNTEELSQQIRIFDFWNQLCWETPVHWNFIIIGQRNADFKVTLAECGIRIKNRIFLCKNVRTEILPGCSSLSKSSAILENPLSYQIS